MRGRLITVDGLDGSGKATQTDMLCKDLERRGVRLRRVSFPDYRGKSSALVKMYLNGEFGGKPEDVNAYAASSFFAVDRFASYVRDWRRDYLGGTLIVADRYTTSNMIYQMPKLPRGEWESYIRWAEDFEYGKLMLPKPDLTVYLKLSAGLSQKLLDKRYRDGAGKKDIHERDITYQTACEESAAYAAELLAWKTVSCEENGNLRTAENIHEEIVKMILKELSSYAAI